MPHLRMQSRRAYLEKRKEDKIAELEADIADDEYLFESTQYDQLFIYVVSWGDFVLLIGIWLFTY